MKVLFILFLTTIMLPDTAQALSRVREGGDYKRYPASSRRPSGRESNGDKNHNRGPMPTPCEPTAHRVAEFIENESWGKLEGYHARTVTFESDGRDLTFQVRVEDDQQQSASGYTYEIGIRHDVKSEACVVLTVSVKK